MRSSSLPLRTKVPLAPLSTFGIGGKAEYYVAVTTLEQLARAIEFAETKKLPFYVLGGGSNVVFADRGYRGLIIHLRHREIAIHEDVLLADAGASLGSVVQKAAEHNLAGIERLAGIPGSFGGAVRGNAGAFGTEIGDVIVAVKCFDQETSLVRRFSREQCRFQYRSSVFKEKPKLVILSAELKLRPGVRADLERIMAETKAKREKKHPQDARCAGSFFMNPVVHDERLRAEFERDNGVPPKNDRLPAGWLIDQAGLRGKRVGGAMVSLLHPNYILNTGTATAEDILMLASLIKMRVRDEYGVRLQEEVQYVGLHS